MNPGRSLAAAMALCFGMTSALAQKPRHTELPYLAAPSDPGKKTAGTPAPAPGKIQPHIVGGTTALAGAYPWMTALVWRGNPPAQGQFCGGVLIHPQWVLTAAHCMSATAPSQVDVVVGIHDLRVPSQGKRIDVAQVINHPQFSTTRNGENLNDVSLLKLAQPLNGVPVLPLVVDPNLIVAGKSARALGWGATAEGGANSPVLLQVDLSIVSIQDAKLLFPNLSNLHLAASVPGGGKDACQGDSGGPLLVSDSAGKWYSAGIVSFGSGCARPGYPGIYANTHTFRDWIVKQTGIAPGDDHGNTAEKATTLVVDDPAQGSLGVDGDVDVFRMILTEGGTLLLSSRGTTDVVATLANTAGTVLAEERAPAGDAGHEFRVSVPAGIYTLAIRSAGAGSGDYGLLARLAPRIAKTAE